MKIIMLLTAITVISLLSSSNAESVESYVLSSRNSSGLKISVKSGDQIVIKSSGNVNTHPNGSVLDCDIWTDPDGIKNCVYVDRISSLNGLPFMALVGNFNGDNFYVGKNFNKKFTSDGTLTLKVNDWLYNDNVGDLSIDIFRLGDITRIDPLQSSLLSGTSIITDPNRLVKPDASYEGVLGVAADGVSRIIVRIPAISVGEQLTVSITQSDGSTDYYGGLANINSDLSALSDTLPVTAVSTNVGPMAFAVYKAPVNFTVGQDDNLAYRYVTLQVLSNTAQWQSTVDVKIIRPPVVLVHGVWSNPTTWNCFAPLVLGPGGQQFDNRFSVSRADYHLTNAASFAQNAPIVLSQVRAAVNMLRSASNVAAVQADIVAHSMGGNIVRTFVLLPNYLSNDTFGSGVIHKLITLDTPYNGSQLANNLQQSNSFCKKAFGSNGKVVAGATTDLAVGSAALLTLQSTLKFPIPAHAIAGVASNAQTSTAEGNAGTIETVCPSLLPTKHFVDLFAGPSDLIVSQASQQGVGAGYLALDPPPDVIPGFIHAVDSYLFTLGPDILNRVIDSGQEVCINTNIAEKVIDLLNSQVDDGSFQGIRP